MKNTPEQLALQHSLALCQGHADALQDALQDIKARGMGVDEYANLVWLASADEWQTLGQIRNQFAHDYPDHPTERFERLQAAIHAAAQLIAVLTQFQCKIKI